MTTPGPTVTVTASPTSESPTSQSAAAVSAAGSTSVSSTSAGTSQSAAVTSIDIKVGSAYLVGPNVLQVSEAGTFPSPSFEVTATGDKGIVSSSACTTVLTLTGPGGYSARRRSTNCTVSFGFLPELTTVGTYQVTASVTGPGATRPVTGAETIRLIAYGG